MTRGRILPRQIRTKINHMMAMGRETGGLFLEQPAMGLNRGSQGVGIGLAGADAPSVIDAEDKDFAIANLPGPGRACDRLDDFAGLTFLCRDLNAEFWQEGHFVLVATIDFGVASMPAVTLDLGHGHAMHANCRERILNVLEFERFDDRNDELHERFPSEILFGSQAD
jgi:hypothetical protein